MVLVSLASLEYVRKKFNFPLTSRVMPHVLFDCKPFLQFFSLDLQLSYSNMIPLTFWRVSRITEREPFD